MFKWFLVLMLTGVSGDNEEIYVNEELGTMLISKGLLIADQRSAYVSSFIRVPNPLSNVNLCNLGCGRGSVTLDRYLMAADCKVGVDKTGLDKVADTVIKGMEYEADINGASEGRVVENWCLFECLRSDICQAFGVREGNVCWLRNRALTHYEMKDQVGSVEVDLQCVVKNNKTRVCEELLKEDSMNHLMIQENEKFVREHWETINQLIGDSEEVLRRKRSLIGTLAGASIGFLATGFSFFEMNKLGDHVEKLKAEYKEFKERQVAFDKDQVEFNNEVLMVYKGLERETQKEIRRLHCGVSSLGFHILNMRRLLEWKDFLYQLYKDVLSGSMVGTISTVIFTKENMRDIVKETGLLKGTIYEEDPTLAYRLGTMSIVDKSISEDRFVIHVVLKLPIIKREELKVLFEVQQTEVRHEEACVRYNLPRNVYRSEGKFYELESPMCSIISNIKLCTSSINSTFTEMPCVTNKESCVGTLEKCSTKIRQSVGGVLVRSQEPIRAAVLGDPDTLDPEQPRANSVVFFNYSRYGDVLVGRVKIKGIRSATLDKVMKLSDPKEWLNKLRNETRRLTKQNITILAEIVEDQTHELGRIKESTQQNRKWTIYITPILTIMVLITIGYECVWMSFPRSCRERVEKCVLCRRRERRINEYDEIGLSGKRSGEGTDTNTEEDLEMISRSAESFQDTEEWVNKIGAYEKDAQLWEKSIGKEMGRIMKIKDKDQEKMKEDINLERNKLEIRSLINRKFHEKLQMYPMGKRNKTLYDEIAKTIGDEIIKQNDLIKNDIESQADTGDGYERLKKGDRTTQYKRKVSELQSPEQQEKDQSMYEELKKDMSEMEEKEKELNIDPEMEKKRQKDSGKNQEQPIQKRAIYTVKFPGAKAVRVREPKTGSD